MPFNRETHTWVRLKDDPANWKYSPPGTVVRAYGHDFLVQEDNTLGMPMHNHYLVNEVKANRVEIVDPPDKPHIMDIPPEAQSLDEFVKQHRIHDVQVIEDAVEEATPIGVESKIDTLAGFTLDVGTFYGSDSFEGLMAKIESFKNKGLIAQFIEERFKLKLPDSVLKDDMIERVKDLVGTARVTWQAVEDGKTDPDE